MNLYNHKIRNKKLVGTIVIAVILGMFVLRGVLLGSGTIEKMYTLEPDELHAALSKYEVTIRALQEDGGIVLDGGGTILDGRKSSSKDENFTLTIAAAAQVVGDSDSVTVVLPDGSSVKGIVVRPETDTAGSLAGKLPLCSAAAQMSWMCIIPEIDWIALLPEMRRMLYKTQN